MASKQSEAAGKQQAEADAQSDHPTRQSASFSFPPDLLLSGPDGSDGQLTLASFDGPESGGEIISRSPSPTATSEASQAVALETSTSELGDAPVEQQASGGGDGNGTQPQYPTIEGSFKASEHLPG